MDERTHREEVLGYLERGLCTNCGLKLKRCRCCVGCGATGQGADQCTCQSAQP